MSQATGVSGKPRGAWPTDDQGVQIPLLLLRWRFVVAPCLSPVGAYISLQVARTVTTRSLGSDPFLIKLATPRVSLFTRHCRRRRRRRHHRHVG